MISPVIVSTVTVPFAGGVTIVTLVSSRFPSGSVSFAGTSITIEVSSSVVTVSSLATGGLFTELIVIITNVVSHNTGIPVSQIE
ncbi:hypothetical protein D3C71_1672400 [compost metagenome]